MLCLCKWFFLLQPDRVMEFCNNNDLQLIVRAHECVMDGFERFAQGHLITLFSATNYCGVSLTRALIYVLSVRSTCNLAVKFCFILVFQVLLIMLVQS